MLSATTTPRIAADNPQQLAEFETTVAKKYLYSIRRKEEQDKTDENENENKMLRDKMDKKADNTLHS